MEFVCDGSLFLKTKCAVVTFYIWLTLKNEIKINKNWFQHIWDDITLNMHHRHHLWKSPTISKYI